MARGSKQNRNSISVEATEANGAFAAQDLALQKVLCKFVGRIERILQPVGKFVYSPVPEMLEWLVNDRVKRGVSLQVLRRGTV